MNWRGENAQRPAPVRSQSKREGNWSRNFRREPGNEVDFYFASKSQFNERIYLDVIVMRLIVSSDAVIGHLRENRIPSYGSKK